MFVQKISPVTAIADRRPHQEIPEATEVLKPGESTFQAMLGAATPTPSPAAVGLQLPEVGRLIESVPPEERARIARLLQSGEV